MKKFLCLFMSITIIISTLSCSKNNSLIVNTTKETREFIDSLNRAIVLPKEINRVAVTGPLSQIIIFGIGADKLVGTALPFPKESVRYFKEKYTTLPVLGQLYGGKGQLNIETLIEANPDVIIDIGETKSTMINDFNSLTEKTGIPFIHITFNLNNIEHCYNKLGELFDRNEKAQEIIAYCKNTLKEAEMGKSMFGKANVTYCLGKNGLNVICENSYFSEVIDLVANNVCKLDTPSNKGSGNEIDMEQMIKFNPDYIIFETKELMENIPKKPEWTDISAIKNNNYYLVPQIPYNILGFPPGIQQMLGIKWLLRILYPDFINSRIEDECRHFYKLFFDIDLTDDDINFILNKDINNKELY